jgi:hypothetical protein
MLKPLVNTGDPLPAGPRVARFRKPGPRLQGGGATRMTKFARNSRFGPHPGAKRSPAGFAGQSAVMPASLITFAHSATSALMMAANWSGGALFGSHPAMSSFSRTSAVASAA